MPRSKRLPTTTLKVFKDVQIYVDILKDFMGLQEWKIVLDSIAVEDNSSDAEIHIIEEYKTASMALHPTFFDFSPQQQRDTLVHELCHIYTSRMASVFEGTKVTLGDITYTSVLHNMTLAEEWCVEAVTKVLSPLLPLPKFRRINLTVEIGKKGSK